MDELRKALEALARKLEKGGMESACDEVREVLRAHPPEPAEGTGLRDIAMDFLKAHPDAPAFSLAVVLFPGQITQDDIEWAKKSLTAPAHDGGLRDAERLDWLQGMMLRDENYCEIYLAGLRNWTGAATAYQVESNPEKFPTVNGPDLRIAIDNAMAALRAQPPKETKG